jgi:hypothetical protein
MLKLKKKMKFYTYKREVDALDGGLLKHPE